MSGSLEFVGSVTVLRTGVQYRITLPKRVVERMGLRHGDKLLVYYDPSGGRIILVRP